jgi:hypothetical protein
MSADTQERMLTDLLEKVTALQVRLDAYEHTLQNAGITIILSTFADLKPQARAMVLQCLDVRYRTDGSDSETKH